MNGTLYGKLRPVKGLSIEATVNYSPQFGERHTYGRQNGYWDYMNDVRYSFGACQRIRQQHHKPQLQYVIRNPTRYTKSFGDHFLGVLAGYSAMEYRTWGWGVGKKGATDWTRC